MKKYLLLPTAFLCVVSVSCKKNSTDDVPPYSPSAYAITCWNKVAGDYTNFYSSNNKYKEEWDFGDGNKLSLALGSGAGSVGPIHHIYKAPGIYAVTLVVNGDEAHKITQTDTIAPNYWFHYVGTPVAGDTLYFRFKAFLPRSGVSYYWTFGDGATSNDSTPFHVYSNNGTYVVRLTINGNPSNPNIWQQIPIYKDPVYTHQLTKMRLWHGTEHDFGTYDSSIYKIDKVLPDSSFAIDYINKVTVSYNYQSYIFNPALSTGNYIAFSGQPGAVTSNVIYYNYVSDSASIFTSEIHQPGPGKPPVTQEIKWHSP